MAWKKNSPAAVARFDALAGRPGAERGAMFGCPLWKLGGETYAMMHEERLVLRLSPDDTKAAIAAGAEKWTPMPGRGSKDKLVLPAALFADDAVARRWISKAAAFAG